MRKTPLLFITLFALIATPFSKPAYASEPQKKLANPPILGGCEIFPQNNYWNTPIDELPVHASSSAWINSIGATRGFHMDFGSGTWDGGPIGIPYNIIAGSTVTNYSVDFYYPDESDIGPYPIPSNPLIEHGSDHHILIIDTEDCTLYEIYDASYSNPNWFGGSGAIWDLNSNALRPNTWTSADAAGLPILPGLARYEEILAGEINHALRFTTNCTANYYIWPARHVAQSGSCSNPVPFGARFRLKANYDISGYSPQMQILLQAMKKYGIVLADNGSPWYVSGAPHTGWNNDMLHELDDLTGNDFEAVDTSSLMIDPNSAETPYMNWPLVTQITRANSNPTNANSVDFTVTFSKDVTGVDLTDFVITTNIASGVTLNGVTGSGNTYTLTVNTGNGDGTIRLDLIDDDSIIDSSSNPLGDEGLGNGNFTTGEVYTIDKTPPNIISINRVGTNPSKMLSVSYLVTFSESVIGIDNADFALNTNGVVGTFISTISGSGSTRVVSVNTGQGDGEIQLNFINNGSVTDLAGNLITSGLNGETYNIDKPQLPAPILRSPRSTAKLNDTTPNLIWQRVAKAQSYQIQIADSNDFSNIIETNTTTLTTYTPSALVDNTYYWRVRAIDVSGGMGEWSQTRIFTIDTVGPVAPTLISPTNGYNSPNRTVTFRWQAVIEAVQYRIQIDNNNDFSSPEYTFTLRGITRRMNLPSGIYHWRVQAKDALGNWGDWSAPFQVNIP
ncbi:MAG: hypothetical protein JNJ43_07075 [Anaerolineales bacterium]|nr:hypothetical protein [Anaerolineales bacterium]